MAVNNARQLDQMYFYFCSPLQFIDRFIRSAVWFSDIDFDWINGICTYDEKVYAIFNEDNSTHTLRNFDYSGKLIDTISYSSKNNYFLSISDDILYSYIFTNEKSGINGYNIKTGKSLDIMPLPSFNPQGIDVVDGKFYFSDFDRQMIGVFDLFELD